MRLKKCLCIASLIIVSLVVLLGCDNRLSDKRKDYNVQMYQDFFINTSDTIKVNCYNDYGLVESTIDTNEDGSITVTLIIDKPIKKDEVK